MIHEKGVSNPKVFVKVWPIHALLMLLVLTISACSGDTVVLPAPRFAQVGELRADVQVPLNPSGRLEGTIVWQSDGRWSLVERIYHRESLGAEVSRSSIQNLRELSAAYASLVVQLNESPALRLSGDETPFLAGPCTAQQTKIRFSMVDSFRDEIQTWDRCVEGNLFTLTPGTAGPDAKAARIVTAVQLVRSFTVGDLERSVFQGSLPFATLDSGDGFPQIPPKPTLFRSNNGTEPPEWTEFWNAHGGPSRPAPEIRWDEEMVVLLADGDRREAGHRLRVRRVLPVAGITVVEAVEEIPGDFCTPAFVTQRPYHIVRVPKVPAPIQFGEPIPLRVSCGQ